jgi:hypothetical protein
VAGVSVRSLCYAMARSSVVGCDVNVAAVSLVERSISAWKCVATARIRDASRSAGSPDKWKGCSRSSKPVRIGRPDNEAGKGNQTRRWGVMSVLRFFIDPMVNLTNARPGLEELAEILQRGRQRVAAGLAPNVEPADGG